MGVKCSNCSWPLPKEDPFCHRCGTNNAPPEVERERACILDLEGFPVPVQFHNTFQLLGSERAVGLWRCRSFDEERSRTNTSGNGFAISPFGGDVKVDGVLLLTNKRLVLLKEDYRFNGIVRTNERLYSLTYVLDLSSLVGLEVSDGSLTIKVKRDEVNFRRIILSRMFRLSPEQLVDMERILPADAKANLQALLDHYWKEESEREGDRIQVLIDFSFLKNTLEKGGIILQSSKCPNCGGLVDLPEGGTSVRCDYCGGALQAIDVLERIRALLGEIRTS